jgi:hypothetical protein
MDCVVEPVGVEGSVAEAAAVVKSILQKIDEIERIAAQAND